MKNPMVIYIVVGVILLLLLFNKKVMGLAGMVTNFAIRNDSKGLGTFGAQRDGHIHQGLDIRTTKGEKIKAPFDMSFAFTARVYSDDPKYLATEYKTKNGTFRVMYMQPVTSKKDFKQGEIIGIAQSISEKWGNTMLDHIHVEIRENGKLKNPANYV
jgi:hypothetical protein